MEDEFIKNILEKTNNSRQIKSSIKEIDGEVERVVRNFYKPYFESMDHELSIHEVLLFYAFFEDVFV